ncbi:hypothetical protein [Streptomyces sp. NPDC059783]|uniref:hypothetical protein n=1 Tax=Streptomyces sp. NPDC059783 TaxID=3346944 RepID=UPI003646C6E1
MARRTSTRMTVADLRRALDIAPDWAPIRVTTYDDAGCATESDPYITYDCGVLLIDVLTPGEGV